MDLAFHTLDVFTDQVFGGNPLGVVPEAEGLDGPTMQRLARELNLSETVFLLPAETAAGTRRVRIFTPTVELPFAGHPTIGTAWFLAESGGASLPWEGTVTVVLEEGVGPVPVELTTIEGRPVFARFSAAQRPEHRPGPGTAACAELLSLDTDAIGEPGWEPEMVSVGLPFLIVPVRDVAALGRARVDPAAWDRYMKGSWARGLYPITARAADSGVDLRVRLFAPGTGVPEDPATGSAAAALAAYMGRHAPGDGTYSWRIEQGIEMGRPSLLEAEADVRGGAVEGVRVGGRAVMVSQGTLTIPGAAR